MFVEFLNPSEKTSCLVRHFLSLRVNEEKEMMFDKYIPDGNAAVVINFRDSAYLLDNDVVIRLPKIFFIRPSLKALKIRAIPPFDTFIIVMNSSVFSRLFDLDMTSTGTKSYCEYNPFRNSTFLKGVELINSFDKRVELVENFLVENHIFENFAKDNIDMLYDDIMEMGAHKSIGDILKDYDLNPRTFRRNFLKRVGVSAKGLSRIVRVNYVWDLIKAQNRADIQNIIFNCHYYDQSHFIKDFKKVIGEPPKFFFTRDLSQVVVISGKK